MRAGRDPFVAMALLGLAGAVLIVLSVYLSSLVLHADRATDRTVGAGPLAPAIAPLQEVGLIAPAAAAGLTHRSLPLPGWLVLGRLLTRLCSTRS